VIGQMPGLNNSMKTFIQYLTESSSSTTSLAPVAALPDMTTQGKSTTHHTPHDAIAVAVTEVCSVKKLDANSQV
jgi:hypothetical protein